MSIAGVLSVPLFGGQLRRLAEVRFNRGWTLAVALGLQLLATTVWPTMPTDAARGAHLASYVFAAWFLLENRHRVGMWIVAIGTAMNAIAIAANGGLMPASPTALRRAGIIENATHFANSAPLAHAHLRILGDIFAVPSDWPLANVFSVGDVMIVIGVIVTIHMVCGVHLPRPRSTDQRGSLSTAPEVVPSTTALDLDNGPRPTR